MGELGWAESTATEQIMMRRHQHAPAASIGAGDWYSSFAPQLHSTKKAAGELATSGCGSAAAGEKAACSVGACAADLCARPVLFSLTLKTMFNYIAT